MRPLYSTHVMTSATPGLARVYSRVALQPLRTREAFSYSICPSAELFRGRIASRETKSRQGPHKHFTAECPPSIHSPLRRRGKSSNGAKSSRNGTGPAESPARYWYSALFLSSAWVSSCSLFTGSGWPTEPAGSPTSESAINQRSLLSCPSCTKYG
ncbi:hypothetical protein BDV18DRAFT_136327 [Aspergillus unguis]